MLCRLAVLAATGATLIPALPVNAQDAATGLRANLDFRPIPAQPVPGGGVIEVVEFFWYGCPYCDQLQPHFRAWLQRQPADIVVRRVPAVFRPTWVPHARLYYALEALGALERLHQQVYDSYHAERARLDSTEAIADWAASHGIERERWLAVYGSQDIDRRVEAAREQLQRYTVSGTPTLVVDGQFLTSSGMTPGVAAMIPVLDGLVAQARAQRRAR
jgi:protein dithiol oxidoreductase (disulfide-forming)